MRYLFLLGLIASQIPIKAQETEATFFLQEQLSSQELLTGEYKDSLRGKDLSPIWTSTPNFLVLGFIGDDYQRLRIKFITITKDSLDRDLYHVAGKDKVKSNICTFQGELRLSAIRRFDTVGVHAYDEVYRDSLSKGRYVVCGTYRFAEDPTQQHTGEFSGTFASYFFITDQGSIHYDEIDAMADGYVNNQFVGEWRSYTDNSRKTCNWGDYRIPNSKDLDGGTGDFYPEEKYAHNGWQSYLDAYSGSTLNSSALEIEQADWWK
jgi:hypothetical protein